MKHYIMRVATALVVAQCCYNVGWAASDSTEKPVILEPVEGDDSFTTVAGTDTPLRIKVSDTYADQNVISNGYQIFIIKNKDTETSFVAVGGEAARYVPGLDGYLYLTNAAGAASDKLPTVQYSVTDPAVNYSILKVQSPISGLQSDERNFSVTVSAPAGYTVNVIDDAGFVVAVPTFVEGDSGTIRIMLDRGNDTGASLYAFLKPANDDSKAAIQCSFLAQEDSYGLEIQKFSTTVADSFVMVDGRCASNSSFKYTVEFRTAPLYQDGELVTSYQCKNTLVIKCTNVIPTVEKVYFGHDETQLVNGQYVFPSLVVVKGFTQTFKAGVIEPGTVDLAATGTEAFRTRWRFSTTGVSTKGPDNADDPSNGVIYGDPETHKAEFAFTKAGTWTVRVDCLDKDMSSYGGTFIFYVTVVDQPAITATAHYQMGSGLSDAVTSFDETDCFDSDGNACINVALGFNMCDFPLVVQLTVTDPGTDNPGQFELKTSSIVKDMGKTGLDHIYQITFAAGETSVVIPVKSLDGTKLSKSTGFQLSTKMLADSLGRRCPNTGDPSVGPDEFFLGSTRFVKVLDVEPVVNENEFYPMPGTNVYLTVIGQENVIKWNFSDVANDFTKQGISVQVTGGTTNYNATITDPVQAAGSHTVIFNSPGLQTVQLTIQDPDGNSRTWTWQYQVPVGSELLGKAIGATNLTWTTGGCTDWLPEGLYDSNEGAQGVRCCGLSNGTNSWLTTVVYGPGTLAFDWKSFLGSRNTKLEFLLDGTAEGMLVSSNDWKHVSVQVFGEGAHELVWRVVTGRSGASASDAAWLNAVAWTPSVSPTLAETLNTNLVWRTEGDADWRGVSNASAGGSHPNEVWASVSGLSDFETATVWTKVYGSGVLSFDWSVSCEEEYDWLQISIDGEIRKYITGNVEWKTTSIAISDEGWHEVRWTYIKDDMDDPELMGENIARLDNVVWVSADVPDEPEADSLPDLGEDPTLAQVQNALEGSVDERLTENITNGVSYTAYRAWANSVELPSGGPAGVLAVQSSPNAWLSYALGSSTLIETAPTDADLKVDSFEPSAESGKFAFTVSVKDVEVGADATVENLKTVFGLEGGTTLEPGGLSSDNVTITFGVPENGKVKFTAGPKNSTEGTFFMKVKMVQ